MTNTTDKSILTAAGKALLAQLNAEEKPLVIDKMIFANVPNRPEYPQPDDVVPSDDVVHEAAVEQRGRLSVDSVIYSTTLTSQEGPFEFNWTGAYCSEYGVLVTIDHHALTPKTADEPGVAGNTLVRSVVLEYKDIAEITNITVDASSWQYNATPRMKKMDDDVAQAIIDQNGKDWFIEDGFLVTPQASAFNIKAGAGYVSGNRVMLEFDRNVQVPNKPSFIYVDAHREGTPTGEQVTLFDFVVTAEEKDDYTDANGVKHFVCKIAQVLGDGSVSDMRPDKQEKEFTRSSASTAVEQSADLKIYPPKIDVVASVGDELDLVGGYDAIRLLDLNGTKTIYEMFPIQYGVIAKIDLDNGLLHFEGSNEPAKIKPAVNRKYFDSVAMATLANLKKKNRVRTFFFNSEVEQEWEVVDSGMHQGLISQPYLASDGTVRCDNGLYLKLIHDSVVDIEAIGIRNNDSSDVTRNNNDAAINESLLNEGISTFRVKPATQYYFHYGIIMDTGVKAKLFISDFSILLANFFFDKVTQRLRLRARKDSLESDASLMPTTNPTKEDTYMSWGTLTQQVGRSGINNIRITNDSQGDAASNKDSRTGCGIYAYSGFWSGERCITDGCHIGSIIISWVSPQSQIEHNSSNIMFVWPSGTSTSLESCFASGTNYNRTTNSWDVTYTPEEDNEFFGYGYLFGPLYYSDFSALACDKIQNSYAVIGNSGTYRATYNFGGCGSEFVDVQYYINAPNATVNVIGGQDWGINIIENAKKVNVTGVRFPYQLNENLSAGVVNLNGTDTFELQNPDAIIGPHTADTPKGYDGFNYNLVDVGEGYRKWRIYGRMLMNSFELKKRNDVNGSISGTIKFYPVNVPNIADFNKSIGEILLTAQRKAQTWLKYARIDDTLTDTVESTSGNYWLITKPGLSNIDHRMYVEVDIELETSYSVNFADKRSRPDDILFLGVDY
ncbi:phage tail protein [Vibrio parahaemolyticus]